MNSIIIFFFSDIYIFFWQVAIIVFVSLAVFISVQFISARKRRTSTLNPVVEKVKTGCLQIINAVPVPICIVSLGGDIEEFNSAFLKLVDLDAEGLKCAKFGDLLKGELRDDFVKVLSIKQHISVTFKDYFIKDSVQYRVRSNLVKQEEGKMVHRMFTFEPLVKRYSRDEASMVRPILEQLILETDVAIVLINRKGAVLMANERACQLYEGDFNSLSGKTIEDILPSEFQEEISEDYNEIFVGDKLVFRGILSKKSGKLLPVSVSVVNVTVEEEIETILFIDDVSILVASEKKLKEAQLKVEQTDKLKASFLANISHEIRTPLNAILGFSELINDPAINENDRLGFIKQIKQSGESLLELIGGIIDFSRIAAGELTIQNKKIDMDDLFLHLQRFAVKANKMKNRPLEIKVGLNDQARELELYSDFDKVFMALKNLIDNAIKFTFSGGVEFGFVEKGNNFIQFYINDTGIGIPLENLKMVFERFVQGDITNTREFGGTGIGLTVSAELIRLMGGYLWIKSTVGVGSSFNVVLPKMAIKQRKDEFITYLDRCVSNKTMLVLDSEEKSFIDLLNVTSCEAQQSYWAQSVSELVNILQSNNIDIVFINCSNILNKDELKWMLKEYKLESIFLGYNAEVNDHDILNVHTNYPFTEMEMLHIYKNYLLSSTEVLSTNSNSISI